MKFKTIVRLEICVADSSRFLENERIKLPLTDFTAFQMSTNVSLLHAWTVVRVRTVWNTTFAVVQLDSTETRVKMVRWCLALRWIGWIVIFYKDTMDITGKHNKSFNADLQNKIFCSHLKSSTFWIISFLKVQFPISKMCLRANDIWMLKEYYEIFHLHTWSDYCFKSILYLYKPMPKISHIKTLQSYRIALKLGGLLRFMIRNALQ